MPRVEALTVKRFVRVIAPGRTYLLAFWQRRGVTVIGDDDAIARLFASCTRRGPRRARHPSHRAPVPIRRLLHGRLA